MEQSFLYFLLNPSFLYQAIVALLRSTFGFPLPWMVNRRPWRTHSKVNTVEFNFRQAPIDNFMEVALWEFSYCRKKCLIKFAIKINKNPSILLTYLRSVPVAQSLTPAMQVRREVNIGRFWKLPPPPGLKETLGGGWLQQEHVSNQRWKRMCFSIYVGLGEILPSVFLILLQNHFLDCTSLDLRRILKVCA